MKRGMLVTKPILLMLLVAVAAGATGCASKVKNTFESRRTADGIIIGDTRNFHKGEATAVSLYGADEGLMKHGLGIATLDPGVEQGTAFLFNEEIAIQPVDSTDSVAPLRDQAEFFSSYFFGVPSTATPSAKYTIDGGKKGIQLQTAFHKIDDDFGPTMLIVGEGDFNYVSLHTLMRPANELEPIYGQNYSKYFKRDITEFDVPAAFVAVLHRDMDTLRGSMARIVWSDPDAFQPEQALQINGAILADGKGRTLDEIMAETPEYKVVGRLTPESRILTGEIHVYKIGELDKR